MVRLSIISLLLFTMIFSCQSSNEPSGEKSQDCLSSELHECIANYIRRYDGRFIEEESLYYSLYLFQKDSLKLFTLWSFTSFPDNIEHYNPDTKFIYSLYDILDRKVIIIHEQGKTPDNLYQGCQENIELAVNQRSKVSDIDVVYDGSLFPETYRYSLGFDKPLIEKSDTFILDILGQEYIEFEKYIDQTNDY